MKIEMPNTRIQQNLLPRLDTWNRCIHDYQPFYLVRIRCRVGVGHHVSDVVRDNEGLVVPQPNYDRVKSLMDPANVFRDLYTKTCRVARGA